MRTAPRVGRVFGLDIYIDRSWAVVFGLLIWSLTALFARWHPTWSAVSWVVVAIAAAALLLGSVLVHELPAALTARRLGVPVQSVTLHLLGGASAFERDPVSPRVEFATAIVGPLTSIALGIGVSVVGSLASLPVEYVTTSPWTVTAALGPFATLLLWLGPINILIGVVGLIPAFPLDGGRIVRAAIWAGSKNLGRATHQAAFVSEGVALGLVVAGSAAALGARVPLVGAGLVGGLWLAMIGWLLGAASIASHRQLVRRVLLERVRVARIMRAPDPPAEALMSVSSLVDGGVRTLEKRAQAVFAAGEFVGMVALRDARKLSRGAWATTAVAQIMTPMERLATTTPDEPAADALTRMSQRDVRQLPVFHNGRLVGTLCRDDIAHWVEDQASTIALPWRRSAPR